MFMEMRPSLLVHGVATFLSRTLQLAALLGNCVHATVTTVSYWRGGENDSGAGVGGSCSSTTDVIGGRTLQFSTSVFWDSMNVSASAAARVGSTLCLRSYGFESAGTNAVLPSLTDNFGLELWVNPSTLPGNQCLAYNGNTNTSGWGLYLAIDAATGGTSFTTDQRGLPRIRGAFADLGAVEGVFNFNFPIANFTPVGDGNVQFGFTNLSGPSYRVLASTNVAAPLNTWSNLGAPTESPSGVFTFTDLQATNYPQRFYRVTTP